MTIIFLEKEKKIYMDVTEFKKLIEKEKNMNMEEKKWIIRIVEKLK